MSQPAATVMLVCTVLQAAHRAKCQRALVRGPTESNLLLGTTPSGLLLADATTCSADFGPIPLAEKQTETLFWLICWNRKTLFRLEKQATKTNYNISE